MSKHVTPNRYRSSPPSFWRDIRQAVADSPGDPPGLELRNPRGPVLGGGDTQVA